jgi:hypothetical protein
MNALKILAVEIDPCCILKTYSVIQQILEEIVFTTTKEHLTTVFRVYYNMENMVVLTFPNTHSSDPKPTLRKRMNGSVNPQWKEVYINRM